MVVLLLQVDDDDNDDDDDDDGDDDDYDDNFQVLVLLFQVDIVIGTGDKDIGSILVEAS